MRVRWYGALLLALAACGQSRWSIGTDRECDTACLGAPCVADRCDPTALASGYDFPFPLAAEGEWAYFHAYNEDAVYRVHLTGSVERLASDWPGAYSMAVRDGALFVGSKLGAGLLRVPLDGSASQVTLPELRATHSVVAFGDDLLVTVTDGAVPGLYRNRPPTGETRLVAAADALSDLAVSGGYGVSSRYEGGELVRFDLGAGTTTPLVTGLAGPWGVAIDDRHVYWAEHSGGRISRVSLEGGRAELLADGLNGPHSLALEGDTLYATEEGGGRVLALTTDGSSPPRVLADGMQQPKQLALWGERLLWGTQGDGTLWWVAR